MFLTSLLCIILTAINAWAYDFEVDGIYYNTKVSHPNK